MSASRKILVKSLVKPFYRRNAGLLAFLLFMMLGAVGRANEAGLLEYHYSLIRGMLLDQTIFILVLLIWFLYARKCGQFVAQTLRKDDFSFLHILSLMDAWRSYKLLLLVQLLLFLPVLLYALVVAGVGFYSKWNGPVILMLSFNLILCLLSARWYLYLLQNPGTAEYRVWWRRLSLFPERSYGGFLIRYVLTKRKLLFFAVKIYSCGSLFLMLDNQVSPENDLRMIFLFYSFGLFGHGMLIHQIREMEESRLSFYRGLPVSLLRRWGRYGLLYLFLFLPEIITIGWLAPERLPYADAFLFAFFGYSMLMLLNSLLFVKFFRMGDYLKVVSGIFFILFIAVLTGILRELCIFSFVLSVYLFCRRYYQYER